MAGRRCPILRAFCKGTGLLKLYVRDWTRRSPVFALPRPSWTRIVVLRACHFIVLFLLLTSVSMVPGVSWRQQLWWLALNFFKIAVALISLMLVPVLRIAAADIPDSSFCRGQRKACPQTVDKDVQAVKDEHQIQTICRCLLQGNESNDHQAESQESIHSDFLVKAMEQSHEQLEHRDCLAENNQTGNKNACDTKMQQSDKHNDTERAVKNLCQSFFTKQSTEQSGQLSCHQSSSTEEPERRSPAVCHRSPSDQDTHLQFNGLPSSDVEVPKTTPSCEKIFLKQTDAYPRNQHSPLIPPHLVEKSLQMSQLSTHLQNPEQLKGHVLKKVEEKLTTTEEERQKYADGETAQMKKDLPTELTAIQSPPTVHVQVYMYNRTDHSGPGADDLWQEKNRLVSFALYPLVPGSGVWVVQLAAAGFYCPDRSSPVLRCAFCGVEVEIGHFRNKDPWEVHRAMSPSCSLMMGHAHNKPMEEQNMAASHHHIQVWFGPGVSKEPLATETPNHHKEKSVDNGWQRGNGEGAALPGHPPLSAHLVSSGHSSEPHTQSQTQHHHRASAMTSASAPLPTETDRPTEVLGSSSVPPSADTSTNGARFAAAFPPISPTSAICTSGTERGNGNATGEESFTPTQQRISQARASSSAESSHVAEPPSSQSAFAQTAVLNSGDVQNTTQTERNQERPAPSSTVAPNAQNTKNTTQMIQTARPAEGNQERTEVSATGSQTQTATAASLSPSSAAAARSSDSPSAQSASTNETVRQVVTYGQLGIYTQEPKRPDLAIASSRLRTYNGWPHPDTHRPEDMAEAGFYFVGVEDLVRCFYCKGGLKSWSRSLTPWVEHARFYPHCPFVGQVKGQEFIDVVQELRERNRKRSR